jgi:hypothetical protein
MRLRTPSLSDRFNALITETAALAKVTPASFPPQKRNPVDFKYDYDGFEAVLAFSSSDEDEDEEGDKPAQLKSLGAIEAYDLERCRNLLDSRASDVEDAILEQLNGGEGARASMVAAMDLPYMLDLPMSFPRLSNFVSRCSEILGPNQSPSCFESIRNLGLSARNGDKSIVGPSPNEQVAIDESAGSEPEGL